MEDAADTQADPDRALYVDRRFRPRPHGRAGLEAALAEPPGRPAGDLPVRAAGRLHAGCPRRASSGTCPAAGLALAKQWGLAAELRARGYGTALVLPRTWKAAIAPTLAGIPERVGFFGEARFGLINRMRWGEKALPRFIDKNAALALPAGAPLPPEWPVPQLVVPREEIARWRQANDLGSGPAVALAPGSVGASKRWTYYPGAARLLVERGLDVWVVGGPGEKALAQEIVAAGRRQGPRPHRHRPAQRHSGDGGGRRRHLERFRPDAYRSRDRHADHGHFRPHQSLSVGAAERPRRHGASDQGRAALPALPAHRLHHERPPLHARHRSRLRGRAVATSRLLVTQPSVRDRPRRSRSLPPRG